MKKLLVYSAGLIATYLIVNNSSGSVGVLGAGASGGATLIQAFQGRGTAK